MKECPRKNICSPQDCTCIPIMFPKQVFTNKARAAIDNVRMAKAIDDDDWDQRPDNICKGCGNHKDSCSCKKTARVTVVRQAAEPSIDFYN